MAEKFAVLASALAFFLTACDALPAGSERTRLAPRAPVLVVTEAAALREIHDSVEAIGTARANESVVLTSEVTDKVREVRFDDGDFVNQGDVLVELTNQEETALLAEAEAKVDDARRQLTRLEDLLIQRSVPVSQADEARARLAAAEARYDSIVARLDDRLITAPFSGLLGFREVSKGTLITPGTTITTLDDISTIKLDVSIPEVHLNLLRPGLALQAWSAAYPDNTFDAQVRTVRSRVDPITRSATIRAHIDNRNLLLRPGMLMTVRLTTSRRQALMVPEEALVQRADKVSLYTVAENTASSRPVTHGARHDGWVEILSGLAEGEPVIVEGTIKVRDGSQVRILDTTAAADDNPRPQKPAEAG